MRFVIIFFLMLCTHIFGQANLIQSVDIDSQKRIVYGITGDYDSSYVVRYSNNQFEIWNLTKLFNLEFYHISTTVDDEDNIWAFMQDHLYKYDGTDWDSLSIPSAPKAYVKISDLSFNNGCIWLSTFNAGIYNNSGVWKLDLSDTNWTVFNSESSVFHEYPAVGTFFHSNDTTWVGTNYGLISIHNDSAEVILDSSNVNLPTERIYSFYIDSQKNKWLGTFYSGLIKWDGDTTFTVYNTTNSNLPHNFVNAIDEDSKGRIWLGTDDGFAVLCNDTIKSYSDLTTNSIITLRIDDSDNILMGASAHKDLLIFDGSNLSIITGVDELREKEVPTKFELYQNYPNPFNPSTTIKFTIPLNGKRKTQDVKLVVYDILGREIKTLINKQMLPGKYEVNFNGNDLTSGVYFYVLQTGNKRISKKMLLVK